MGRIVVEDSRDAAYPMRLTMPRQIRRGTSYYFRVGPILNQREMYCPHANERHPYCGEQGFCVGAAWRQWLSSSPHNNHHPVTALSFYHRAQQFDQWPGEAANYAGTSVRGGAKALQSYYGIIENYYWAQNFDDVLDFLLGKIGTVVVGTMWHDGMLEPDEDGFVHPTGRVVGGHAYLLVGANLRQQKVRLVNSWGEQWGQKGQAWISFDDLERLLFNGRGEACAATLTEPWRE